MCPYPNQREGWSFISIGVRFCGGFGRRVDIDPMEGYNTNRKRRIRKDRIVGQVTQYKSLGVWRALWDNGKYSCRKSNTLKFEGGGGGSSHEMLWDVE